MNNEMYEKKTWREFQNNGLLWFINMILHVFGWAIMYEIENNEVVSAYPARVKFRGFSEESNTRGYKNLNKYMKDNAEIIYDEAKYNKEK